MDFPDYYMNYEIAVLGLKTSEILSYLLNQPKLIKHENGLPRDWQGLAELCNISGELIHSLSNKQDPTKEVLNIWNVSGTTLSVGKLLEYLEILDRTDIVDDIQPLIVSDIECYKKSQSLDQKGETPEQKIQFNAIQEDGSEPKYYDAILLYADEDMSFANFIMESMESKYGLKLFIKWRQLLAGDFQYSRIANVISRCSVVITIFTDDLFANNSETYYNRIALALNIEKEKGKLIPIIYKAVNIPPEFIGHYKLDFTKDYGIDMCEQLAKAIKNSPFIQPVNRSTFSLKQDHGLPAVPNHEPSDPSDPSSSNLALPESELSIDDKKNSTSFDYRKREKKKESSLAWFKKVMFK